MNLTNKVTKKNNERKEIVLTKPTRFYDSVNMAAIRVRILNYLTTILLRQNCCCVNTKISNRLQV